jgi:hypothetical protein
LGSSQQEHRSELVLDDNIIVHMVDNEDWIVNWVINNKATEYRRARKFEEYTSIVMIRTSILE